APVRRKIVVLDLKFRNRILGRKNERQIDIADIEWLPVQILGALVRKGAANLKISEVERVLAHGRAIAVSLRYYGGSDGGEVKNVAPVQRSEEHTSELQSPYDLVCRLLLEKKKKKTATIHRK